MKHFTFDKPKLVKRIKFLMKREGVKPGVLIEQTEYKRSTFYRHMNLSVDDLPGIEDLLKLSYVLNTSLDYLARGKGAAKVAHLQNETFFNTMKMFYNEEQEAYGILLSILTKLKYEKVEALTDKVVNYGVETKLF